MKNLLLFSISFISLILFSCNNISTEKQKPKETVNTTPTSTLFVGTYTKKEGHVDGKADGIYQLTFNPSLPFSAETTFQKQLAAKTINPSYLTISPNKKYLYAVQELGPNDGPSGLLNAYTIDPKTKQLSFINSQETKNYAPCHVVVDHTNQYVFVANYVGGVVAVFPIEKNGGLGEASQVITLKGKGTHARQDSSHPHSVNISPDNRFLYVPDLGTDKIMIYQIDLSNGKLTPAEMPFAKMVDESGPRHMDFHPNGKTVYVMNEMSSTVTVLKRDQTTGALTTQQNISSLPEGFSDFNNTADIHVHPSGKFVYASNRGHDSIAIFKVNPENDQLTLVDVQLIKGKFPRNFVVDPKGDFLLSAGQNSDDIFLWKINSNSGQLSELGSLNIPTPVCLKFW